MISKKLLYTAEDIGQAFDLHYANKFPIRSRLILLFGVLLLLIFFILFFIPTSPNNIPGNVPKYQWLFLALGVFYILFYFYRKKSIVKLALRNPTLKDMETIELHEHFIRLKGKNGESNVPYVDFKEVGEDDNSLLLYFTKNNFLIIPKRIFNSQELKQFKDYLTK